MEKWQKISLILCTFGFLKELRPSEPFITEYIINFKNVTADELIHVAFPVSTYSSFAALGVVLIVTDLLRYRPIVILEALLFCTTWAILIYGYNLQHIILVEILYGIACSCEVAYYTYIYAKVTKENYTKVTSQTSSALYAGKFLGGVLAQTLVSFASVNYHHLTCLTFIFSTIGLMITFFLPKVQTSVYFHNVENKNAEEHAGLNLTSARPSTLSKIRNDFVGAYSNKYILKWSIWWALASAGQYQVINYIQALWEQINEDGIMTPFNGLVKALHTLLSSFLCLAVGYLKIRWSHWGESMLGVVSLIQGFVLIWMAMSSHLYTAYVCYTIFRMLHPIMLTIASAEVARGIREDSYGLIFGFNTLIALSMQTVLTLAVSDKRGFSLGVVQQFIVYGVYFCILGFVFALVSSFSRSCCIYQKCIQSTTDSTVDEDASEEALGQQ